MTADPLGLVAVVVLFGGLALATVGLIGVLRRGDVFQQLHAAGLVTGPATLLVLLASIGTGHAETITSAILVLGFILVTTPLAAHAIAQAEHRRLIGATGGRAEPPRRDEAEPPGLADALTEDADPATPSVATVEDGPGTARRPVDEGTR